MHVGCPYLTPSDFHLFLHLKKFLGGMRFDDDAVGYLGDLSSQKSIFEK